MEKLIDSTELQISTINVTTINGNKDLLTNIKGRTSIQQHQSPENIHESFIKCWERKNMRLCLKPPGTHTGHSSADVAYQHGPSLITTRLNINTPAFQRAYDIGRVIHCGVVIDTNVTFTFFSEYGYTGGHGDPAQAILTSNMVHAIDMRPSDHRYRSQRRSPPDIPRTCERRIGKNHWIDVAGRASL